MLKDFIKTIKFHNIKLNSGPDFIDLEPTIGCNLKCRMCHVKFMKDKVSYLPIEEIDWSFCKNKEITIGSAFEPTIHPKFNYLIEILNDLNCKISLITNGHNLNKKSFPALFESKLNRVTFSFDGISKNVYEEIREGGNFEQTLNNIEKFIKSFSDKEVKFIINYTVLKSNLSEIEYAPKFWNNRGVNMLNFIGMVVRYDDSYIKNNNLWDNRDDYFAALENAYKNVLKNNLKISISSPYYYKKYSKRNLNEKDISYSPHYVYGYDNNSPLENNCNSPFSTVRITSDGGVHLCHWEAIGNLKQNNMENIWKSKNAQNLRKKIFRDISVCNTCDYFKLCIKSSELDVNDKENYYSQHFKERN